MHELLGWLMLVAGLVLVFQLGAVAATRRIPGSLCPRRKRASPFSVRGWFWIRRCGYDLSGLAEGTPCPECGRPNDPGRSLARARAWRATPVVVLLIALVAGSWAARSSIRSGSYVRITPTRVLVALERPGRTVDYRMQKELSRRFESGEVTGANLDRLITAAASELDAPRAAWGPGQDDYQDRRRARNILSNAWPDSRGAIESLLGSPNWSAKCFASDVLWDRQGGTPSEALLAATVEQLRHDSFEPGRYYRGGNAKRAVARLVPHAEAALPLLEDAIDSADPQQRLLAALIIAGERIGDRRRDAAFVLVDGMRSNDTGGDAMVAASGLWLAGREAWEALDHGRRSDDPQQATWSAAIADLLAGLDWERIEPRLEPYRLTLRTRRPLAHDTISSANLLGY